jgi:hypothetical protein
VTEQTPETAPDEVPAAPVDVVDESPHAVFRAYTDEPGPQHHEAHFRAYTDDTDVSVVHDPETDTTSVVVTPPAEQDGSADTATEGESSDSNHSGADSDTGSAD